MGYTKRQFVTAAFEEIGLASYVFDLEPEQLQGALRKLDAMIAMWNAKGIRLGYPIPSSPENSDLDDETGVPDSANLAIILNLAIEIAPSVGKIPMPSTEKSANFSYKTLLSKSSKPIERQITGLPKGAGHKSWRDTENPFMDKPDTDPLQIEEGGNLDFIG
jgi:hypothetical protein